MCKKKMARLGNNSGMALLMAVFVISLASIVVMGISYQSRFDFRSSRAFAENIQSDYILKSGLNVARTLLVLPKGMNQDKQAITQDWLGDMWAKVGSLDSLNNILSDIGGELRLQIVDEDGKININNIVSATGQSASSSSHGQSSSSSSSISGSGREAQFWQDTTRQIFDSLGFQAEAFDESQHRTIGNKAYATDQQLVMIEDWIDKDTNPADDGGIESKRTKNIFFNRQLKSITEILLVPGMTLERLHQISPYITAISSEQSSDKKININTAPFEVLRAMGIPDTGVSELIQDRMDQPADQKVIDDLAELAQTGGAPSIKSKLKLTSSNFSVLVRVKNTNSTRWLRAAIVASGIPPKRKTKVSRVEFY